MTFSMLRPRELFWELAENEAARRRRARILRAMYALVDPTGWDARRLAQRGPAAAQRDRRP